MRMKRFLSCIIPTIIASISAMAQSKGNMEITHLNWNEMKIDSLLPHYTEVVPLESDFRSNDYSVIIEYPEYAPLTKAETEIAKKFADQIDETIKVETFVGVERKKGLLDISFIPIIRKGENYMKLLNAQISIINNPKGRAKVGANKKERYAAHSRLQSGKWVKIGINNDGMYRLTRSALQSMGFRNPEKVHLYGYGGHLQDELINATSHYDDLNEVPLYYSSATDSWMFWGNGLMYWKGDRRVLNHYANHACYFLTEEETPSKIATEKSSELTPTRTYNSYREHTLYEKDEYSWYQGGRIFVENVNYAQNNTHTYSLSTSDPVGNERLTVSFTASSTEETKVTPIVNGVSKTSMTLPKITQYISATMQTTDYDLGNMGSPTTWNVKLTSTAGADARLDYLAMNYDRKLKPQSGYVSFSQSVYGTTRFDIEGSNLVVMRTSTPSSPATIIEGKQEGPTYSIVVDEPSRQYVAFNPSYKFPEPTFMGKVDNQDLHANDSLDMVIIIPASGIFQKQAQRLADAHALYDGMKVGIVRADQVYNEFSSGTPDATAYRRYMKMLYDKVEDIDKAPRYLLLMGDCAWDNRMCTNSWKKYNPDNYLLCFESEESFSDTKSYVMEDYFGLLDDGEGANLLREKSDIGIGRFPVTNDNEANTMVSKSIRYISNENAGPWKNLVYVLGDDGDNNQHMEFADNVAERTISYNPEMEVRKIMWDHYSRVTTAKGNSYPEVTSMIKKQMDEGCMVINYTGHAATYGLSHEFVLLTEDFRNAKGTKLPLWVTCACDVMPFDGQKENIGETAVLNPDGGAMAFYGTARTVYASQNLYMNRFFMQYLFAKDSGGRRYRLGDAIRLAKNAIINEGRESIYRENKLQYALLGDPALLIGAPVDRVVLDSINGVHPTSYNGIQLKAGQKVTLKGHLSDASGNAVTSFDGVINTKLYDSEEEVVCHNNAGATNAFTFTDRSSVLYESQDSITSGEFALEFIVPIDINYSNGDGRLVFYAINNDRRKEANGYNELFTIGDVDENYTSDGNGPVIMAFLGDENFRDGDVVNSTPFFFAQLSDESGINSNGNGIGHNLLLCVDGKADQTYVLDNYYTREFGDFTRGTVAFSIPQLEAGEHTLSFRAWDVLNNTSQTTLHFKVDPSYKPSIFKVMASENPASTSTNFLIYHDMPGSECTFTLELFDFTGKCMWKHQETGSTMSGIYSIPWNLSNGGGRLGPGVYLYRCQMQCGESKKVSKTQKIVILNNK